MVPDPFCLSRAQPHREDERLESRPPLTGAKQSQPIRVEKTHASRGNAFHTMAESLGASRGGHPSKQPIHAEGNFPFIQFILKTLMPERWKMPTFDKYDGTTNQDNHMRVFTHQMMFHVVSDPIWCRVFSTSLTGKALEWFSEQPANNIEKKMPKFTTYTPLAIPRAKILQVAFSVETLPAPRHFQPREENPHHLMPTVASTANTTGLSATPLKNSTRSRKK